MSESRYIQTNKNARIVSVFKDDDVDYGIPPCHRIEEPSTSFAKQGPKTPPGSPNHDHETEDAILSADEWHNRSLRSTSSRHSDLKISSPPLEPPLDDNEFTSRAELLQTFSQVECIRRYLNSNQFLGYKHPSREVRRVNRFGHSTCNWKGRKIRSS